MMPHKFVYCGAHVLALEKASVIFASMANGMVNSWVVEGDSTRFHPHDGYTIRSDFSLHWQATHQLGSGAIWRINQLYNEDMVTLSAEGTSQIAFWNPEIMCNSDTSLPGVPSVRNLVTDDVRYVCSAAFPHKSDLLLATGGSEVGSPNVGAISFWNLKTAYEVELREKLIGNKHKFAAVTRMVFSEDGSFLACGDEKGAVFVLTMDKSGMFGFKSKPVHGHKAPIRAITFYPDSEQNIFVTGSEDRTIVFWKFDTAIHRLQTVEHRGAVRDILFYDLPRCNHPIMFSASDTDGMKAWVRRTSAQLPGEEGHSSIARESKFEKLLHIHEPCSAPMLWGDNIIASHGSMLCLWPIRQLFSFNQILQLSSGRLHESSSPLSIPSILRLPDKGFHPKNNSSNIGDGFNVTHVALSLIGDLRSYGNPLTKALSSAPWILGTFLERLAEFTTNHSDFRLKRLLAECCLSSQTLYLATDTPYLDTSDAEARLTAPLTDALTLAIAAKAPPLVEYILLDIIQALWLQKSLSLVFKAQHLVLLLTNFPLMTHRFLRADVAGVTITEICIERCPQIVVERCTVLPASKIIIRGSYGAEPHYFWEKKAKAANR